jgi:hypothetical protein
MELPYLSHLIIPSLLIYFYTTPKVRRSMMYPTTSARIFDRRKADSGYSGGYTGVKAAVWAFKNKLAFFE